MKTYTITVIKTATVQVQGLTEEDALDSVAELDSEALLEFDIEYEIVETLQ